MTTSDAQAIAIVASGVVSSLGGSAASTCAAVRSALNDFRETDFLDDAHQPLLGAAVPSVLIGLDDDETGSTTGGLQRLAAMFVRAATECARYAGGIDPRRTALLLVGAELDRPGVSEEHLLACFEALSQGLGQAFHPASRITRVGSAGVAAALERAQTLLGTGSGSGVDWVLIAAADSLLNGDDIDHALSKQYLLTTNNGDGYIPGEACACVMACRLDAVAAGIEQRPAVLRVRGIGMAEEPENLAADRPARGKGLAQAMRQALRQAGVPAHALASRLSDGSAQSWFSEESSYAWARVLRERSPQDHAFLLPSTQLGHVGAAMGPMLLALALDQARRATGRGSFSLLQMTSPASYRGAAIVQAF